MVMLDFIYMGSADLFRTGRERKIQNEKIMFPAGFEPTPRQSTTGRKVSALDRSATLVRYQEEHL